MPPRLNLSAMAEVVGLANQIAASRFDASMLYAQLFSKGYEPKRTYGSIYQVFTCKHGVLQYERETLGDHYKVVGARYLPNDDPDNPFVLESDGKLFTGASLSPNDLLAHAAAEGAPLRTKVLRLVAMAADRTPEEISLDDCLAALELDEVAVAELTMELEERFRCQIDDSTFSNTTTVADFLRTVERAVQTKSLSFDQ